ncbi:PP2C family protein-serine/threonine phosphatase [Streptomyces endophyticus]|uniref:Serine/threonine-protein phosphatase n=1 Tax=Streptomyces endophyticus TaxID=714166 RepID=A0ABU6F2U9_9ACTN|nr:PP2C family protein-serine/threonine phosphatase [Streptomyces endophyticus]MEB8338333.1 serine/threonine-protein phosphatase [Streptomyces endophyticus]
MAYAEWPAPALAPRLMGTDHVAHRRHAARMDATSPVPDARTHLALQSIRELLAAQQRRIRNYADAYQGRTVGAAAPTAPVSSTPLPPTPSGREVLEALSVPALLVAPLLGEDGRIRDALHVAQNTAARAYATERLPQGGVPRWQRPASLFERFPSLAGSPLPDMLAKALRERAPQGPILIEWVMTTSHGPVRINDQVRVAPCGEHLLITWERGHRLHMAAAAQQLVRTCWAEWNLGDGGVDPSRGFRQVLGLDAHADIPTLSGLAATVAPESLPELYRTLYDVILRKRTGICELRLNGAGSRVIRMTAEPVRIAPGSLVWALRAVLTDVTAERRRRASAERAEHEARRQRQRAEAVAEVANALREAVLPHFQDELAAYGLEAAAVYRPDAREAGVGGDWYKARGLPGGRLLVALGDARGHGLAAATLMAKLRYALAGLAYTEQPVEQLTQWLNESACADGLESTATAIIARYHPERGLLRWACAGHPRPVLVRDGAARQLPDPEGGPGLPLGVLPGTAYAAAEAFLRVDDIVLMYSDGLTERRDSDPDLDTQRFLDVAQQCHGGAPGAGHDALQEYAERIVGELDGPHRSDDATLLVLRRIPTPPSSP